MAHRIEIVTTVFDSRAQIRKTHLKKDFPSVLVKNIQLADVYTIDKNFPKKDLEKIVSVLANPVTQQASTGPNDKIARVLKKFNYAIEIGFLPGVTDNIASTTKEIIADLLKIIFREDEGIYTSQIIFIEGDLTKRDIKKIADSFYNPLIERAQIKTLTEYKKDKGMDLIVPQVKLKQKLKISKVNLEISDEDLLKIGKSGITGGDKIRRGPLALDLPSMKTIRNYFKKIGRVPNDIEIESLAQTWSEHCKHTIFADPLDELKNGLFRTYIKKATDEIRKKKKNFCLSVFTDNSGAITFDNEYLITHKVETHNSPSALDPFGGAITGIVGVNRDTIGFGLGAKPVANIFGFCFANPLKDIPLYKGANFTQKLLSSRRIMDGVIDGVNAGGNQSGIPTPLGFLYFDDRFRGKPLVFVGTIGLMPKKIKGKPSYLKKAKPGDYIVMVGGRVGKDGIHGATFSSETMDSGSPVSAVQIGDPITQKKLSDAIVKEARNELLYNSIKNND